MTHTNFNIDEFTSNLTGQVKDVIPSDITQETVDFIINTMDNFLHLAYEAISNDNELNPTNDDYILLLQILAEWIFHKSVDISRSKVPFELWDNIIQHIAFTIFEIVKESFKKEVPQDDIVNIIESHVNNAYKHSLQELFDKNRITKEIFEAAIAESNIDKMAEEYRSIEQENIIDETPKSTIKKKQKNPIQINKVWTSCKQYILYLAGFILLSAGIWSYRLQIMSCITTYKDLIIPCTIGIVVLFALIGLVIYVTAKKRVEQQLKKLDNIHKQMQDLVNPDQQFERLGVDILRLEIGAGLLCIADPDQDGMLLAMTAILRQELTDELGYIIPKIRIIDSSDLYDYEYKISVRGQAVCSGYVYPEKLMVLAKKWDEKCTEIPENATVGVEPIYSNQCYWIDENDAKKHADIKALTPENVIKQHLKEMVINHVDYIITSCDIEKYIERVRQEENSEKLIENIKERLDIELIRKVFVNLIREKVSIKDIIFVFERLCDYARFSQEADILSERLRTVLGRQICLKNVTKDNVLYALTLSPEWEKTLDERLQRTELATMFLLNPSEVQDLIERISMTLMCAREKIEKDPVILCPPNIRLPLFQLLVRHIPTIVVISYAELITDIKVEKVDEISFEQLDLSNNSYSEIADTDNQEESSLYEIIDEEELPEPESPLGRIIDSDGNPLDGKNLDCSLENIFSQIAPVDSSEPAPITKIFKTGVRAVDAFLTIGYGQKMGVFAPSGCGLSTFLGLILKNSEADINIVSLVSNSIDNAWDFINYCVKYEPNIQRKTIVICSTPLDSAEKIKKNFETAISLCEYYRDKGKNVLFINDKTEPILDAAEIIARKNGEPACENDYRLEVTRWYQNLINRCKNNDKGSITTILTVNTTSVDKNDKVVNIIRSATQGHIFLSRKVAEQNIYPAIDVLGSISRSHIDLASNEHKMAASTVRKILSLYREGSKDEFVLKKYNEVVSFIQQRVSEKTSLEETLQGLVQLTSNIKFKYKDT